MKQVSKTYAENYRDKIQKKYLWNIFVLKGYLKQQFDVEGEKLKRILRRCSDHCYGRVMHLNEVEQKIYSYLERMNLHPTTVYRWFLASRLPEEVKVSLGHPLPQSKAIRLVKNYELKKELVMAQELMNEIRLLIQEML